MDEDELLLLAEIMAGEDDDGENDILLMSSPSATAAANTTTVELENAVIENISDSDKNFFASTTADKSMQPYPFFHYVDYSKEPDPEPFIPLTTPGRVPNFPAKMHAILSRPEFSDIICWMPHGRSWKILKPREFEARVIPDYFEHVKFSSFIRQANGWGFRRISKGHSRSSYYHPRFLRGLPHLCKAMKRPRVAEKVTLDPDHEPDLDAIARRCPLPSTPETSNTPIYHHGTGPMPIYTGFTKTVGQKNAFPNDKKSTPEEQEAMSAFQHALDASELHLKNPVAAALIPTPSPAPLLTIPSPVTVTAPLQHTNGMHTAAAPFAMMAPTPAAAAATGNNPLAAANQLAMHPSFMAGFAMAQQFMAFSTMFSGPNTQASAPSPSSAQT